MKRVVSVGEVIRENSDGSVTIELPLSRKDLLVVYQAALNDRTITLDDVLYQSGFNRRITVKSALIGAYILKCTERFLKDYDDELPEAKSKVIPRRKKATRKSKKAI